MHLVLAGAEKNIKNAAEGSLRGKNFRFILFTRPAINDYNLLCYEKLGPLGQVRVLWFCLKNCCKSLK